MPALHFYDRGPDRPWANPLLTTAAIVGHTTETTARIWIRVWKPGTYFLLVSTKPISTAGKPFALTSAQGILTAALAGAVNALPLDGTVYSSPFDFETDLTAVFEVNKLIPETDYYYGVFAQDIQPNDWEIKPDPSRRRFRSSSVNLTRMAFGLYSCHMPYKDTGELVNVQMWENFCSELERFDASFVIGAGDQVYSDGNKKASIWRWLKKVKSDLPADNASCLAIMRSWYRDIFRGYWGAPQVRRLYERFPQYMIWDDHEIMDGWGSYTNSELANELDSLFEWQNDAENLRLAHLMFEAAKLTYHEYEHSHNPPTLANDFDYFFSWGPTPFYVLDMRGQRDFNRKSTDKILGRAQMKRFLAWVKSPEVHKASAIFIVSPVPIVHVASFIVNHLDIPFLGLADDLRDEWEHESNWHERNTILDTLFSLSETSGKTIVFLSGDVHVGAAFKLFRQSAPAARVFQLTSSGITYATSHSSLEFVVRENGELGDSDARVKKNPTSFRLLHRVVSTNNFGIVTVNTENPTPAIEWNVYGNTGHSDEILRLKSVRLE